MAIFEQNIPDPRLVDKPRPQFETQSPVAGLIEFGENINIIACDAYKYKEAK